MNHTLTVSEPDFVSAQRLHAKLSKRVLIGLTTGCVVLLVALCVAKIIPLGAAIGGIVGYFSWFGLLFLVIIPFRAKQIYRQQKNLHVPHYFSWDSDAIYFKSEDYEGKIRWSDFTKVKENRRVLLLYHSDVLFNIFPKISFDSPSDLEEFQTQLHAITKG